jgi:hypothetical protein
MKTIYIISIILILIIFFLHNKKKEHLLASNESINNIASIYSNATGTVSFNNINSSGIAKFNNLDVSGSIKFNNLDISGNINTTGNINTSGNINTTGNINKKQNKARYIRIGNRLLSSVPKRDHWAIKEVEVYDQSGTNIAKNKTVTITAGNTLYPDNADWGIPGNIVNGKATTDDDDCYHGITGDNELEIDLGAEYDITQINVYNRYNNEQALRANNTSIQLLDANRNVNRVIYTGNWDKAYSKEYIL